MGRTPKLDASDLSEIHDDITISALTLDAMDDDDLKVRMQHQKLKNLGFDTNASLDMVPISDTSFKNYKAQMKVKLRKGKIKPKSRDEPYKT
jgi:hypothetical protein